MSKLDRHTIRFRILAWRDSTPAWKRWLLWKFLGRDYCPHCNRVTCWGWHAFGIRKDGPPMLFDRVCDECGTGTGLEPTEPMRKALESGT